MKNLRNKIIYLLSAGCLILAGQITILADPISGTAILTSLLISAALTAASIGLQLLLAPRPKAPPKQKLNDISFSDSVWGAPVYRIYGQRGSDNIGGIEVGTNVIWASDIRKVPSQTQGSAGSDGGGKGSRRSSSQVNNSYKIDFAAAIAEGKQRLLRVKLNEDIVFENHYSLSAEPTGTKYEAEDGTRTGTAAIISEGSFSSGEGVGSLNSTGTLELTLTGNSDSERAIHIGYKSASDVTCEIVVNGETITYLFPATGTERRWRTIYKVLPDATETFKFQTASSNALKVDAVIVEAVFDYAVLDDLPYKPSGIYDEYVGYGAVQDNYLFPERDYRYLENINRNNVPNFENADGSILTTLANGAEMAFYPGSETQAVDSVISAWVASQPGKTADYCPAFRGIAYLRLSELDFTKYGAFPNVRVVVENIDSGTVEEILLAEAEKAGLDAGDLDFSVGTANVRGYIVPDTGAPEKVFNDLAVLYNLAFTETVEGKLAAIDKTDRTAVATLTVDDLAAYSGESDEVQSDDVTSVIPDETEMPHTLEIQFFNPLSPMNFASDRREHIFPFTDSVKKESFNFNACLLPQEAELIIKRLNQERWLKLSPHKFNLTHKYAWLNAGDCVYLPIDGNNKLVRIESKDGSAPGNFSLSATAEDLFVNADGTLNEIDPPAGTLGVPAATFGTLMQIPYLLNESIPGIYVAACPSGIGNWNGAALYRNKGNDWQRLVTFDKPCLMGRAVEALADVPGGYATGDFDVTNTIAIDFYNNFQPDTITSGATIDGGNLYIIGNELCYVQTWTRDNDFPNRWVGSDIIRQGKNTRSAGHAIGERVVFFTDAVKFLPLETEELGVAREWKFATAGEILANVASIFFTWTEVNTETLSPSLSQLSSATNTAVDILISNYTTNVRWRKIEVSVNSDMSAASVAVQDAVSLGGSLSNQYHFTKTSDASAVHRYFRISHSTNGVDYSPVSNTLDVTFADSGGSGGGSGVPAPDLISADWDGINTVSLVWVSNGGTSPYTLQYRQKPVHYGYWSPWQTINPAVGAGLTTADDTESESEIETIFEYRIKRNDPSNWSNSIQVYIP